jgi:rSAM/selenodomain-associated transferase 2
MKICVIIPALNEATELPSTLACIGTMCDIFVADGGSTDATCDIAHKAGAHVIRTAKPRSHQLNVAARQSDADILLFLHADTQLPDHWQAEVIAQLQQSDVTLGAFSLRIADASRAEAFIATVANWRSRVRQLPYGDQGLFLRRSTFESLSGFPNTPIMDDYIFVKAAQKIGRVVTSRLSVTTSNRRWRTLGVWRTTWRNQLVVLGYHMGVSLGHLRRYYRH